MTGVRSIPAHTGKPVANQRLCATERVYPRPHGEACPHDRSSGPGGGLSPPTRGSPPRHVHELIGVRSIPAHTGKPHWTPPPKPVARVYPRPHGEAITERGRRRSRVGLSPPTRGSRPGAEQDARQHGSIPAHTGKPTRASARRTASRVYPRPHGEATLELPAVDDDMGLSPPTRGSRLSNGVRPLDRRSIPAHTGKPLCGKHAVQPVRVYPRPHGEAVDLGLGLDPVQGLSPPTRGSPLLAHRYERGRGSIPAHTGKPDCQVHVLARARVYPRPHGEAFMIASARSATIGLSPPTRGSLRCSHGRHGRPGSIPAHTGKPPRRLARREGPRVYPRPHGEAGAHDPLVAWFEGLSPPTRGSPCRGAAQRDGGGSIPAHTGKPNARRRA